MVLWLLVPPQKGSLLPGPSCNSSRLFLTVLNDVYSTTDNQFIKIMRILILFQYLFQLESAPVGRRVMDTADRHTNNGRLLSLGSTCVESQMDTRVSRFCVPTSLKSVVGTPDTHVQKRYCSVHFFFDG